MKEKKGYHCPDCSSHHVITERRPDGDSTCKDCLFKDKTAKFTLKEIEDNEGVKKPELTGE